MSGKVVIFSHGFGVKRDSRGMFTEIGSLLKNDFLVVRFDYSKIDESDNATIVYPFSIQAKMLERVIEYIRTEFPLLRLNIIAHSMGCLIVGLLLPDHVNKIILMVPPPTSQHKGMKEYFLKRPETEFNEDKISKIKRSDGSWTFVGPEFWSEIKKTRPAQLFKALAEKSNVYFIRAKQDEIITGESYKVIKNIKRMEYMELKGNHNFEGKAREPLLQKIVAIIKEDG